MSDYEKQKEKLQSLDKRYRLVLDEYVTLYPKYKVYKDSPSISKKYSADEGNMYQLQNDLFSFKNNLENNIVSLSEGVEKLDDIIGKLTEDNKKLKKQLASVAGHKEGAYGSYIDAQTLYQEYYLGNWLLVFTMIATIVMCKNTIRKPEFSNLAILQRY